MSDVRLKLRPLQRPPAFHLRVSAALSPASLLCAGLTEDTLCVGVARLGADDQVMRAATLRQLVSCDLGGPLHSLVVTGQLHPLEVDMLQLSADADLLKGLRVLDGSTYWS